MEKINSKCLNLGSGEEFIEGWVNLDCDKTRKADVYYNLNKFPWPFKDNEFDGASISLGLHDMPYEIELLVLKEMKRVTKKYGPILIVEYNEPKKHLIARLTHLFILLYETPNYVPFIKRGLENLLKEVGLKIDQETNFLGLFQILLVKNYKT